MTQVGSGSPIDDQDVQILANCSAILEADYARDPDDPWIGSPFAWIRTQPSRTKGAIGEKLIAGWAATKGFDVVRSSDSEADRIIEGWRVEIKFSSLWAAGGFKFQQIREQNYDYCFCLGLSPFDAQAWFLPKDVLRQYVIGHTGQHTGAAGTDTAWLNFQADAAFDWMTPHGGRLRDVARILHQIGRGPH